MTSENHYPDLSPVSTGIKGKCPRCGRGKLFNGYLTVAKKCSSCDLDYGFADAGDGATWFVMVIASTLAVGMALWVEFTWRPSYWVHAAVAIPMAVLVPLLLLRPAKAFLINQQYKRDAAPGQIAND
jgi:uncharacterized protein (DUF983 family)